MRRRLLITYLSLLAAVLVGFALALGLSIAAGQTQALYADRLNDTARFASLAGPPLRANQDLGGLFVEFRRYQEIYGVGVALIGAAGQVRLAFPQDLRLDGPEVQARIQNALAGNREGPERVILPWQNEPMVVAEPVQMDGEKIGAVVTISPTGQMRSALWRRWAVLAAVSLFVLLVGAVLALPLTRWMLRPVHDLDEVTHAITEGRLRARVNDTAGPTELRRLAASFNTMADTITKLLERQRMFVSYASHQLRNPLAALRLRVELLAESVPQGSAEDLGFALDEVDRLTRICDALLTLARAESTEQDPVPVDAGAIADERVAAWLPVAHVSGIRLERTGMPHADALAVPDSLDQALDALIDNALKFAGFGAKVTVHVNQYEPGFVNIHVVDNGPGLATTDLDRAVQPFWRRSTHQNLDGSGLGLAIVRSLLTASGGDFELFPGRPCGLNAQIRLPIPADRRGPSDQMFVNSVPRASRGDAGRHSVIT